MTRVGVITLLNILTRQQAVFFSLIEQFKEASGSIETMSDSAGTLRDSYDTFLESVTAHINSFKAAFQNLSNTFMSSDFLKGAIDLFTDLVNTLDFLVDKIGGLPAIVGTIAAGFSFKNIGRGKMFPLVLNMPIIICVPSDTVVFI